MPHRKAGTKNWYIKYTDATGRKCTVSSGTSDFLEAKRIENQRRGQKPVYKPSTGVKTIEDVLYEYLTAHPTERGGFAAKKLLDAWQGLSIAAITPEKITHYKRNRKDKHGNQITDSTLRRELGVLRSAINYCNHQLDWQLPEILKKRLPRESRGRIRWIKREDADRLVECATGQHIKDFILLGLHTGMRKSELLGLTWNRVDLLHGTIHFKPGDHKSKTHATIPINATAREVLERRLGTGKYVIHIKRKNKEIIEPLGNIKKSFATACKKAGIVDFTPHDLRHTCASWLVQAGIPIAAVCEVLRHSDIHTTMRYAHLAPENARNALAALDQKTAAKTAAPSDVSTA